MCLMKAARTSQRIVVAGILHLPIRYGLCMSNLRNCLLLCFSMRDTFLLK